MPVHVLPLFRPLNALITQVETDLGLRFFLIDSGCPFSFGRQAKQILNGEQGWDLERAVPLRPAPFDLTPFSERLGVSLEGFIGTRELIQARRVELDYDLKQIKLGGESSAVFLSPQAHVLPLRPQGHFYNISAQLDQDQAHNFYIDTGARFIYLPQYQHEKTLPLHLMNIHTFNGIALHQVSPQHQLQFGQEHGAKGLNLATGISGLFPPILGHEWLSRHHVQFDFTQLQSAVLSLVPRNQKTRPTWEEFQSSIWGAPFDLSFNPSEYATVNRGFELHLHPQRPLPDGFLPFHSYRLEGFEIPEGPEGINALYDVLYSDQPSSFCLIDSQGQAKQIERSRLFTNSV